MTNQITKSSILDCIVDAPDQYHIGNPALVEILNKDYPINSLGQACDKWLQIRDLTQMRASQMPHIAVLDADRNYLGHITYNGSFCSIQEEINFGIFRG